RLTLSHGENERVTTGNSAGSQPRCSVIRRRSGDSSPGALARAQSKRSRSATARSSGLIVSTAQPYLLQRRRDQAANEDITYGVGMPLDRAGGSTRRRGRNLLERRAGHDRPV